LTCVWNVHEPCSHNSFFVSVCYPWRAPVAH
jgi:hypothetical protein